jgi:pectate lyase
MITVTNTEEFLIALEKNPDGIEMRPGRYVLPGMVTVATLKECAIYGSQEGIVQIVGRFILLNSSRVLIDNISFRAPVSDIPANKLVSYDALSILSCSDVAITRCSIIGGADEACSVKEGTRVSITSSLIGGCFDIRNHDMAMLVECDDFWLTSSVITAADKRCPLLQEWQNPSSTMTIAGNLLVKGRTQAVGVKPKQRMQVDVVDNLFVHTPRSKIDLDEVEVAESPTGVAIVYFAGNRRRDGQDAQIDLVNNSQHITQSAYPFTSFGVMQNIQLPLPQVPGPSHHDNWHVFLLAHLGNGKTWKTEKDPGFPEL